MVLPGWICSMTCLLNQERSLVDEDLLLSLLFPGWTDGDRNGSRKRSMFRKRPLWWLFRGCAREW